MKHAYKMSDYNMSEDKETKILETGNKTLEIKKVANISISQNSTILNITANITKLESPG
jgi:hypothetical protein